jgi:HEAT repeat protein
MTVLTVVAAVGALVFGLARSGAALALARVGTEQGRKLLEHALVADPVPSVRAAAAVALGQMGEDRSLDALRKAAGDPFSLVRASVATVLARSNDPRAAAILQSLTHDPRRRVRRAAMC